MNILSYGVEMPILKQFFKDAPVAYFSEFAGKLQSLPEEK